jgi:Fe-S cluster biosynthesis and repair protein YggX
MSKFLFHKNQKQPEIKWTWKSDLNINLKKLSNINFYRRKILKIQFFDEFSQSFLKIEIFEKIINYQYA